MLIARFLPALLLILTIHCSSLTTQVVNERALRAAGMAEQLADNGKMAEAQAMIYNLQYLHPDDPAVRRLQDKLTIEHRANLESLKLLGKNAVRKKHVERNTAQRIIFYLPDLCSDFLDIFSVDVSVGPQIGLDLHTTRALSGTAYTGATLGLGKYQKQLIALRREGSVEINVGPVGPNAVRGSIDNPILAQSYPGSEQFLLHRPSGAIYQSYRDYWSAGGKFGFLLVGTSFEIHLLEIADFLTGIAGYDLLGDNFGATENYALSAEEIRVMNDLSDYIGDNNLRYYQGEYPKLNYKLVQKVESKDTRIRIPGDKAKDEPANVIVFNFANQTKSSNYGYVSTSLSSAIYDSMKVDFVFRGAEPDANAKLAERLPEANAEAARYLELCEQLQADYLIFGSFEKNGKNAINIVARVYGRQQKQMILEIRKTTKTDTSLFETAGQISGDVVKLMKKLPGT